jgi:hypothetical protein
MLITHGQATARPPPEPVLDSLRFDKFNHWPIEVEWDPVKKSKKRANCRQCYQSKPGATPGAKPIPGVSSKAGYKCSKCNVALHINCFKD